YTRTPLSGDGTAVINPSEAVSGAVQQSFTITYTAGSNSFVNGSLEFDIPAAWQAPQGGSNSVPGKVNAKIVGGATLSPSFAGQVITLSGLNLAPGAQVQLVYGAIVPNPAGGVTVPSAANYTFTVKSDPQNEGLQPIGSSPVEQVVGGTFTFTPSPTYTASPTATASPTITPTFTASPSSTDTPTATITQTFTASPSFTASPTATPTATPAYANATALINPATAVGGNKGTYSITITAGASFGAGSKIYIYIPAGWTAPQTNPNNPGWTTSVLASGSGSVGGTSCSGHSITVTVNSLTVGSSIAVYYGDTQVTSNAAATAPTVGSSTPFTFNVVALISPAPALPLAAEPTVVVSVATPTNTPSPTPTDSPTPAATNTASPSATASPTVTPTPPFGDGTAVINPSVVTNGGSYEMDITYTAGSNNWTNGGELVVTIPSDWSAPAGSFDTPGYVDVETDDPNCNATFDSSGQSIYITVDQLAAGSHFFIYYGWTDGGAFAANEAVAGAPANPETFGVATDPQPADPNNPTPQSIAAPPTVDVQ
ncbi:MAG TPA: hypothetical protein VNZ54_04895, partial [bacterium]|nr:hypothetical protein [bacterium]